MENFKIERIYLRKLQAIAKQHNITPDLINQAVESSIHKEWRYKQSTSTNCDKEKVLEEAEHNRTNNA